MPINWSNLWSRTRRTLGLPVRITWGIPSQVRGPAALDIAGQEPTSLPSVFGCASLLADALVGLDWWITKPAENGGRDVVTDNEAAATLERWRKYERWSWIWNALVGGNGIGHVIRDGDGAPERIEVYPIGRAWLNLYDTNEIRFSLAPMAGGDAFEADEEDVCCLRYRPSGLDPRVGISPLISASPTVTMLLATRAGTTATQLNGARPSGWLGTAGKLDREKAQEIKDRWQSAQGGPDKRGGTPVLEQGLEYHVLDPVDLVKMAAVEVASLGVAEICRLFQIPSAVMQVDPSGSRSSAAEDRRRLGCFATTPLARLVEDAVGPKLLTERQRDMGLAMTIDTSAELIGAGAEMSETLSKLCNAGIITPNESRAWLAYGSLGAEGDLARAPTNTWPIASWAKAMPRSSDSLPAADQGSEAGLKALRLIRGGK